MQTGKILLLIKLALRFLRLVRWMIETGESLSKEEIRAEVDARLDSADEAWDEAGDKDTPESGGGT